MTRLLSLLSVVLVVVLAFGAGGCAGRRVPEGTHSATYEGSKVAYEVRGRGQPAIVFVHGWASRGSFWEAQMNDPGLRDRFTLIAVDLPGHGGSDKPDSSYTMDSQAGAVAAVMQDGGVAQAVLVGHSNGTPLVRQFYRRFPEKTLGLVVVDGALRPMLAPEMMDQFLQPLRGPEYRTWIDQFLTPMLAPMKDPAMRERVKASMAATPQNVMVRTMEAAADPSIWTEDPIKVPVLAVMAKSPFWTEGYRTHVEGLVPDLEYHTWEGVSHFLMMDEPARFNQLLREWVEREVPRPK
ncbi:MAG TPA: alpha/beta hydrolase [Phycisphaerales bacterium]|nr:alpha/beta hydrolase [Phycisphaerales bacterium]